MVGHGTHWSLQYGVPVGAHVAVGVEVGVMVPSGVAVGVRVGEGVIVSATAVVPAESQRHTETGSTIAIA